jgi:hypothetical protein
MQLTSTLTHCQSGPSTCTDPTAGTNCYSIAAVYPLFLLTLTSAFVSSIKQLTGCFLYSAAFNLSLHSLSSVVKLKLIICSFSRLLLLLLLSLVRRPTNWAESHKRLCSCISSAQLVQSVASFFLPPPHSKRVSEDENPSFIGTAQLTLIRAFVFLQ